MKKWYTSRGVWLGVLTFLTGAIEIVISMVQTGDFSTAGILMAVVGILKLAERMTSSGEQIEL